MRERANTERQRDATAYSRKYAQPDVPEARGRRQGITRYAAAKQNRSHEQISIHIRQPRTRRVHREEDHVEPTGRNSAHLGKNPTEILGRAAGCRKTSLPAHDGHALRVRGHAEKQASA